MLSSRYKKMTIEIIGGRNPSHIENLIYDVRCFSCPNISEENGDFLPGPAELADITQDLTLSQAQQKAQIHEKKYGRDHEIFFRALDIGKIHGALGI
jgi:hypothetical protein